MRLQAEQYPTSEREVKQSTYNPPKLDFECLATLFKFGSLSHLPVKQCYLVLRFLVSRGCITKEHALSIRKDVLLRRRHNNNDHQCRQPHQRHCHQHEFLKPERVLFKNETDNVFSRCSSTSNKIYDKNEEFSSSSSLSNSNKIKSHQENKCSPPEKRNLSKVVSFSPNEGQCVVPDSSENCWAPSDNDVPNFSLLDFESSCCFGKTASQSCFSSLKCSTVSSDRKAFCEWIPISHKTCTSPLKGSSFCPSSINKADWKPVRITSHQCDSFKPLKKEHCPISVKHSTLSDWSSSVFHLEKVEGNPNDRRETKLLSNLHHSDMSCDDFLHHTSAYINKKCANNLVKPIENGKQCLKDCPLEIDANQCMQYRYSDCVNSSKDHLSGAQDRITSDHSCTGDHNNNGNNCVVSSNCSSFSSTSTITTTTTTTTFRYQWMNQLKRIFLQDTAEDAANPPGESTAAAGEGKASETTSSSSASAANSNTDSKASPTSQSASVSLSSSGINNPFARAAAPTATWGASESHDHRPILAPSRLGPSSDSGNTAHRPVTANRPSGATKAPSSIFTPPILTVTGASPPQSTRAPFKLKPSVLGSNPFSKVSSGDDDASSSGQSSKTSGNTDSKEDATTPSDLSTGSGTTTTATSPTSANKDSPNSNNSRSMFVPLARNGDVNDSSLSPSIRNSSFIFGQNVHSKVTGTDSSETASGDSVATTNGERATPNLFSEAASETSNKSADSTATTNGRLSGTGNLFSDAASEILPTNDDNVWGSGQSLAETSRELTEKENSQKRKFDQVEVITGEESESNVLQMNCKLYAWVNGTWQERGRGILRLNDWDAGQEIHSRLVIRTQGTLTVMLNTKVWAEMSVERASSKSVRFTALETDGQPKIFLAMGSPKDVDLLYNSLEWRVAACRSQAHDDDDSASIKKTKKEDQGATAVAR